MGISVGISSLSCIRAEIYGMRIYTFGQRSPSLIPHQSKHQAVSAVLESCSPTPLTWVWKLEFLCDHEYELRFTLFPIYFSLMAAIFDLQHTQTSRSTYPYHSLSMLLDPEDIWVQPLELYSDHVHNAIYGYFPFGGRHL